MAVTALLDVNVLVALAWPNHVHHYAARSWFAERRPSGWATCPITEAGFVRVSCNPSAVQHTVGPRDAIALLQRLSSMESHSFWTLDRSMAALQPEIVDRIQGYRQITDAVLLSVAIRHGGQLATLDGRLARLHPEGRSGSVCVIPV